MASQVLMFQQSLSVEDFRTIMANQEPLTEAAIVCMEDASRAQWKQDLWSTNSRLLAENAAGQCQHVFDAMEANIGTASLNETPKDIVAKMKADFVENFDEVIRSWFVRPEMAQARANAASSQLALCIKTLAEKWSAQIGSPDVIGKAAANSCLVEWEVWRDMQRYHLEANDVPANRMGDLETQVREGFAERATTWVLEARAN